MVKDVFRKIKENKMEKAKTQRMDLIKSGLIWSKEADKSKDKIMLRFINAEEKMRAGTMSRKPFMKSAAQKLPTGLMTQPKRWSLTRHTGVRRT